MNNLELYNKVRSVPEEAKKKIAAGRIKGMTDINPMWRIKVLTENFGICGIGWYYKVIKKWTETVGNEVAAFVDIELFIKSNGEWSQPISGTGGSKLAASEKAGVHVSDECYKMATTDALSVACKQLGIGADVYFEKDRTKYDNDAPQSNEPRKTDSKNPKEGHTNPKCRKINAAEIQKLIAEADRTGLNLKRVISNMGWKDIKEVELDTCTEWMKELKKRQSVPPSAPDETIQEPPEDDSGLPFN